MSDELPSVISGIRREYRELKDGSIVVRVEIDPRFKDDFHRLFKAIDMPIAIAPLVADFERRERASEEPKGGPLCKLACIWCKDEDFLRWLEETQGVPFTEEDAAQWVRDTCVVDTRSQLDHDPVAAKDFQLLIRAPFMEWMKGRGK